MLFASCISTRNVPALDNYGQLFCNNRSDLKKNEAPVWVTIKKL